MRLRGSARLAARVAEQGIGWLIGKTVHCTDGSSHRWPRPHFYRCAAWPRVARRLRVQPDVPIPALRTLVGGGAPGHPRGLPAARCAVPGVVSCQGIGDDPGYLIPSCATWRPPYPPLNSTPAVRTPPSGPWRHTKRWGPLGYGPDTAYRAATGLCPGRHPIIQDDFPQCVGIWLPALAVERRGGGHFGQQRLLRSTWIDMETGSFYGVPAAMGGLMGRPWQLFSLANILEITPLLDLPVIEAGRVHERGCRAAPDGRLFVAGHVLGGICAGCGRAGRGCGGTGGLARCVGPQSV